MKKEKFDIKNISQTYITFYSSEEGGRAINYNRNLIVLHKKIIKLLKYSLNLN